MACLRLNLPGYREISTVGTLPGHTGRGYATALVGELARRSRNAGKQAFLTVNTSNARAYAIYERLGFRSRVNLYLHYFSLGRNSSFFPGNCSLHDFTYTGQATSFANYRRDRP